MNSIELYIMFHLKYAGVEYAKMISKMTGLELNEVNNAIKNLISYGLVERDEGKAIKRKNARFKKAKEVHKHHSYYKLTEKGKIMLRSIDEEWINKNLNLNGMPKKFMRAFNYFIEKHIGKSFKINKH